MRIGIDARMIDNTGIGRYLRNLLIHLARLDNKNEYIVFVNQGNSQVVTQKNFIFVPLKIHVPLYSFSEQSWFPMEIRKWKLELIHYPNFNVPLLFPCPYVVTIHDLIYYLYPDQCPSKIAYYYACFMLQYAIQHARIIMTDSEYSKQDLIQYFHIPTKKIQVIYPAADDKCRPDSETPRQATFQRYRIRQPYLLYVGKHHSYKNIKTLLQAYSIYPEVYEHFQLVIAGKRDHRRQELYDLAARLDSGDRILFTDFVPETELFELYNRARVFVFPSLYEGFGLPPLEAMACGVPVISSNAASLPEVVGDAAIQIDPFNVQAFANAMRMVLTDTKLWHTLKKKGEVRTQQFSWDTAAQELLEIYTHAATL